MNRNANNIFNLTPDREAEIWRNCIFVFDTSALLDFYYYPDETRNDIYEKIFKPQKDRLWIPNHVQFEYLKNRESTIRKPIEEKYNPLITDFLNPIVETAKTIEGRLRGLKEITKKKDTHPYIENLLIAEFETSINKSIEVIREFDKGYKSQIELKVKEILQLQSNDTVLENFEKYFSVGREYSFNEIIEITKEGKHRYEFNIPPGYQDLKKEKKDGTQIFGDLIIWKQILEYAKEVNRNVVFICNDLKEDWCIVDKDTKRIKTPREELIKEFKDFTGNQFWMYNQPEFIFKANQLLQAQIQEEKIDQIRDYISTKSVNDFLNNYHEYSFEESFKIISTFSLDEISRTLKFISLVDIHQANKILLLLYNNNILQQKFSESNIQNIGGALSNFRTIDPILAENIYVEIDKNLLTEKIRRATIPKIKSAIGELNSVNAERTREILREVDVFEKFNYEKLSLKQLSALINETDIERHTEVLMQIPSSYFIERLNRERINDIAPALAKLQNLVPTKIKELYRSANTTSLAQKFTYETIDRIGQNLSILKEVDRAKTKQLLNILSSNIIPERLKKSQFRDFCSVLIEIKPIDNNGTSKKILLAFNKADIITKIYQATFKEICNGLIKLNKIDPASTKAILKAIDLKMIAEKLSKEQPKFEEIANAILNLRNVENDFVTKIFKLSTLSEKAEELAIDAKGSSQQSFLTSMFTFLELDFEFGTSILSKVSLEFLNHILQFPSIHKFSSKFHLLRSAFKTNGFVKELALLDEVQRTSR